MKKRGFTLIELLIVVAIIAVLAAIAVPNFLEAQTRAKVSRVMNDMRTIVNAMAAYKVDNNFYPLWWKPGDMPVNIRNAFATGGGDVGGGFFFVQNESGAISGFGYQLTTPITYLTTIPWDPFFSYHHIEYFPGMANATVLLSIQYKPGGANGYNWHFGYVQPTILRDRFDYWITTPGPNLLMYAYDPSTIYDPTNGTVSNGDLHYLYPIGFIGGYNGAHAGYDF